MKKLIDSANKIAVLTGAGVSTDSGIPDFQSFDESWHFDISREEAISIWFFKSNPVKFWQIYRHIFSFKEEANHNNFHSFLSDLGREKEVSITTQNVDRLHQQAGSENVVEFHGAAEEVICSKRTCRRLYATDSFRNQLLPRCPRCRSVLKPNVSLFGEGVQGYTETRDRILEADLLIVAGTSLKVGPFNELPRFADFTPKTTSLWLNNDPVPAGYEFDHSFVGSLQGFLDEYGYKSQALAPDTNISEDDQTL